MHYKASYYSYMLNENVLEHPSSVMPAFITYYSGHILTLTRSNKGTKHSLDVLQYHGIMQNTSLFNQLFNNPVSSLAD
jgi:hypothetical protein